MSVAETSNLISWRNQDAIHKVSKQMGRLHQADISFGLRPRPSNQFCADEAMMWPDMPILLIFPECDHKPDAGMHADLSEYVHYMHSS